MKLQCLSYYNYGTRKLRSSLEREIVMLGSSLAHLVELAFLFLNGTKTGVKWCLAKTNFCDLRRQIAIRCFYFILAKAFKEAITQTIQIFMWRCYHKFKILSNALGAAPRFVVCHCINQPGGRSVRLGRFGSRCCLALRMSSFCTVKQHE